MYKKIIAVCLLIVLSLVGCSKQDDTNAPEYFVKYVAEGYRQYIIYTDVTGETTTLTYSSSSSFERVIGPVGAGFKAYVQVGVDSQNSNKQQSVRIEVKKGDSPFVLKAENTGVRRTSASYTVEE